MDGEKPTMCWGSWEVLVQVLESDMTGDGRIWQGMGGYDRMNGDWGAMTGYESKLWVFAHDPKVAESTCTGWGMSLTLSERLWQDKWIGAPWQVVYRIPGCDRIITEKWERVAMTGSLQGSDKINRDTQIISIPLKTQWQLSLTNTPQWETQRILRNKKIWTKFGRIWTNLDKI